MFCCSKKKKPASAKEDNPDNKAPPASKPSLDKSKLSKISESSSSVSGNKGQNSTTDPANMKDSGIKKSATRMSTSKGAKLARSSTIAQKSDNPAMDDESTLLALLTNPDLVEHLDDFIGYIGNLEPEHRKLTELIIMYILANETSSVYYFIE